VDNLIEQFQKLLGPSGVLLGDDVTSRAAAVFGGDGSNPASAILRPRSTEDVSEILKLCTAAGRRIVPWGGGTGLVKGQIAHNGELQLSLELMNKVENVDSQARTAVVQAGVTLQGVQEAADDADLFFPLDLGGRGTATIGGNISTNAGGNRVVRYGMARDNVLGIEAVLADGTIISSLNQMIKNNAGYDLKQMFIGTEGTLGVITKAVVRLREKPRSECTAMVALASFDNLIAFLKEIDGRLGGTLSAFEVLWNNYYTTVTNEDAYRAPMPQDYPYYILVEALGGDATDDQDRFERALMATMEDGLLADAVIAKSDSERADLWALRDAVMVFIEAGPCFSFDVSLRITDMEEYSNQVKGEIQAIWPRGNAYTFGHIGDGNIHFLVSVGDGSDDAHHKVEEIVYKNLTKYRGSVSAEHGVGMEKKPWLYISRSEEEIALMRRLKRAMDPDGILNPGKIFDA
jgi:FAD/FMN-containing dehydrogenase